MARVTWSRAEQATLLSEARRLVREGQAVDVTQLVRAAQEKLPKSRRRTISSITKVPEELRNQILGLAPAHTRMPEQAVTLAEPAPEQPEQQQIEQPEPYSKKAIIRWTSDECYRVFAEMKRLALEGYPVDLRQLARKAQIVLPQNRQRRLQWTHEVPPSLRDMYARESHNWRVEQAKAITASQQTTPVPEAAPAEIAPEVAPAEIAASPSVPDLIAELFVRVASLPSVRSAITELMKAVLADSLTTLPAVEPVSPERRNVVEYLKHAMPRPTKERQPVVLVVGVLPDQRQQIERRYGQALRLKWWHGEGSNLLRDKAAMADMVVYNTSFVDHSTQDSIKKHAKTYRMANGGVTSIMRELDSYLGVDRAA